jgi:NTP pyrophosphatase (non-canonical NTP hydrolase)
MTFDEFQKQALTTAHVDPKYQGTPMEQTIWAMGVAGEAGEVLEKWKKIIAYKGGEISDEDLQELKKELGDVVWYIAVLADSLGLPLDEVIELNVKKLRDRKARDVIKGAGDNR